MARPERPSHTAFGSLIRRRRKELGRNKADLARQLGLSQSYVDVLEAGRRGCDLDTLPQLADALELDQRGFAQAYLAEKHPRLYQALFGDSQPDVAPQIPGMQIQDLHWRIDMLPRRERGLVENLVYVLHDLIFRKTAGEPQSTFTLPAGTQLNLDPVAGSCAGRTDRE
jgi:transcriptional regulator with XRE-family HTH domain